MVNHFLPLEVIKNPLCFCINSHLGENFDRSSTLSEYEIIKQLGEGGFGEVVMAIHKRTREKVAIKFLKANARGISLIPEKDCN